MQIFPASLCLLFVSMNSDVCRTEGVFAQTCAHELGLEAQHLEEQSQEGVEGAGMSRGKWTQVRAVGRVLVTVTVSLQEMGAKCAGGHLTWPWSGSSLSAGEPSPQLGREPSYLPRQGEDLVHRGCACPSATLSSPLWPSLTPSVPSVRSNTAALRLGPFPSPGPEECSCATLNTQ